MRKEMTEPEKRLWFQLRAKRFEGAKFRKQKVIKGFIVDFAANNPKLVVELDGDSHAGQEDYDARRTKILEAEGYQVVRFLNSDVMTNMDGILTRISEVVADLRARPPLPTLSPEGERAFDSLPVGEREPLQ